MQGVPVARGRCHVCSTWVVFRWGISDAHGDVAHALTDAYAKDKTKTGAKSPLPFDKPRESVHSDVVHIVVTERFAHLAHTEDSAKSNLYGDRGIRTKEKRRTSRRSECDLGIVPARRTYPARSVGRSGRPASPVGRCS